MDYTYDVSTYSASPVDASAILAMIGAIMIPLLIVGLVYYIYTAWATMTIANKLKVPNGWLAFVPIANLYILTQIADVPWWTMLLFFGALVPFLGWFFIPALSAIMAWWYIRMAKRRGFDELWGIWMFVPLVNLVIIGMMAWSEPNKK